MLQGMPPRLDHRLRVKDFGLRRKTTERTGFHAAIDGAVHVLDTGVGEQSRRILVVIARRPADGCGRERFDIFRRLEVRGAIAKGQDFSVLPRWDGEEFLSEKSGFDGYGTGEWSPMSCRAKAEVFEIVGGCARVSCGGSAEKLGLLPGSAAQYARREEIGR